MTSAAAIILDLATNASWINDTRSNNDSECFGARLARADDYQDLLIVELVIALLSIPPNLLLLSLIWKVNVFCPDLRIVLANFSIVLVWYGVGDVIKIVHSLAIPPCGYHMPVRTCKLFDSFTIGIAVPNVVFSFLALCLQRLYANLRYKTYDKTHTSWLPAFLIVAAWTAAIVVQFYDWPSLPMVDRYVPVCAATFAPSSWLLFYSDCVAEVAAVVIALFIYFYTRLISVRMGINRAQYDLSARFQVDQNARVNSMLLPSICLQVLCHLPNFAFLAGTSDFFDLSPTAKLRLHCFTAMWRLLYATVHPLLGFSFNVHLRKQLLKTKPGSVLLSLFTLKRGGMATEISAVMPHHQTTHFNYLDKIWDQHHQASASQKVKSHQHQHQQQQQQQQAPRKISKTERGSDTNQKSNCWL